MKLFVKFITLIILTKVITAIQNNEVNIDGLEALQASLENRIEENHNTLNKKLGNLEKKFDANISSVVQSDNYQTQQLTKLALNTNTHAEQLKTLPLNKNGPNVEFDLDRDCPTEWNYRKINGGCYYFVKQNKTHNDTKNFCKKRFVMGKMGKLAEPQTRTNNGLIYDEAKHVFQENLEYYIGIEKNSEGNWVYSIVSVWLWNFKDGGS